MDISGKEYKFTEPPTIRFGKTEREKDFNCTKYTEVKFNHVKTENTETVQKNKNSTLFSMANIRNEVLKKESATKILDFSVKTVTLKFSNIPYSFEFEDLKEIISTVVLPYGGFVMKKEGQSLGYAYVKFSFKEDALKAKQAFDGKAIDRQIIDVTLLD